MKCTMKSPSHWVNELLPTLHSQLTSLSSEYDDKDLEIGAAAEAELTRELDGGLTENFLHHFFVLC